MCGRFTVNLTFKELEAFIKDKYKIDSKHEFTLPRYNVAPGTNIISLINDGINYRIGELKWGFVPDFIKANSNFNLINIKSESLFTKPMFKRSAFNHRCVILADSFYEWNEYNKNDLPKRIMVKDQPIFSMAGIWNTVTNKNGKKVHTVAIITTESNDLVSSIHHRMPVILSKDDEKIWLNPSIKSEEELSKVLKPYDSNQMNMYTVSSKINSARYQEKDSIDEVVVNEEETLV